MLELPSGLVGLRGGDVESAAKQGELLLGYMRERVGREMKRSGVTVAKSAILLKYWNKARSDFSFRYWEEDFLGYVKNLSERNTRGELEWVMQKEGLHARDRLRQDKKGNSVRLLRMHYKHRQIFTDHDIPGDAVQIEFAAVRRNWTELHGLLYGKEE